VSPPGLLWLFKGGGDATNEITITVERNKGLYDPNFFVDCLLRTGNRDIDNGIVDAAAQHCEKEKEGLETSKTGVVKKPYKFTIPAEFHVESGFRSPKDPTTVDNKTFIRYQSIELQDKHMNTETCNFVFFFLLGWTTEQFEKKKAVQLLGGGQVRRGGKKVIFSPGKAYGDYDSGSGDAKDIEESDTSPEKPKKRGKQAVSPLSIETAGF
jgi:hypothetical protein